MIVSVLKRYAIFGGAAALVLRGLAPNHRHEFSRGVFYSREGAKFASELPPMLFALLVLGSAALHPWFLLLAHLSEPEGRL